MPNGVVIEREMSRSDRYSHGLTVKRGIKWVLVSVHTSQAIANRSKSNLRRCFTGGPGFEDFPEFQVIPLVQVQRAMSPKVHDSSLHRPQQSTKVRSVTDT